MKTKTRKKFEITKNQLISTGILDKFFNHIRSKYEKNQWKFLINDYAIRIGSNMNYLMKKKKFTDPAPQYIKKLERDVRRLSNMETHDAILGQLHNLYELEAKVGLEYCKRCRQIPRKEYEIDLFFLDLYIRTLRGLKSEDRLEIIADIYLIINSSPPRIYTQWKERHPDYFLKRLDNIKKRLQRINNHFKGHFESREYKKFEKSRILMLKESIKNCTDQGQRINPLLKNIKGIKKYIRNTELLNILDKKIEKSKEQFDRMNILEIHGILDFLKIKDSLSVFNKLTDDNEFLDAFRLPVFHKIN